MDVGPPKPSGDRHAFDKGAGGAGVPVGRTTARPGAGTWRAVVVGDARAARWVRQLQRIELVDVR